jgi:hypothetical protein
MAISLPCFAADTTEEAARTQAEVYRRISPSRRLEIVLQMGEAVRQISVAGVRDRHLEYTEDQVRLAVIRPDAGRETIPRSVSGGGSPAMTRQEFLTRLVHILEAAGTPFMIAGSHGSSYHGRPRSTADVDIVIDPTPEQLDRLLFLLGGDYTARRSQVAPSFGPLLRNNRSAKRNGWRGQDNTRKPFHTIRMSRVLDHSCWNGGPVRVSCDCRHIRPFASPMRAAVLGRPTKPVPRGKASRPLARRLRPGPGGELL